MTISMYKASVPVFARYLRNLSTLLDIAAAHAATRNIDAHVLLGARLYPDMYDLSRQVGEANRHAITACSLLSRIEQPAFPEVDVSIPELKARIARAIDFVEGLQPDQIDGTEDHKVDYRFRNGSERRFTGQSLLLMFSLPQFFFHVATAYDILRHNGVAIAKPDFLGRASPG